MVVKKNISKMISNFVIVKREDWIHIFHRLSGDKILYASRVFPNDYTTINGAFRSIRRKYPKKNIYLQKSKNTSVKLITSKPIKRKTVLKKKLVKRRSLKQIGKSNRSKDSKLKAKLPGKRTSKTGKTYYERRKNRSDKNRKKRL